MHAEPVIAIDSDTRRAHRRSIRGRRAWRLLGIIAVVLLVLVAGGLVALRAALPGLIRRAIETGIHARCPACVVEFGPIDVGVASGHVVTTAVHIRSDPAQHVRWEVGIDRLEVDAVTRTLLSHQRVLRTVVANGVHVTIYTDRAQPRIAEDLPLSTSLRSSVRVDRIAVIDGDLAYVRHTPAGDAMIRFQNIQAAGYSLGSVPGASDRPFSVEATGRVEHSGQLDAALTIDLFSPRGDGRLDVRLRHLDAERLDQYGHIASHVRPRGEIDDARVTLALDDGHLHGTLEARYRGLRLHFEPSATRPALHATLENIGEAVLFASDAGPVHESIDHQRAPGEHLVGFVWRSVRTAAKHLVESQRAANPIGQIAPHH